MKLFVNTDASSLIHHLLRQKADHNKFMTMIQPETTHIAKLKPFRALQFEA